MSPLNSITDNFSATLTYPKSLRAEDLDYVDFGWMKYAPNNVKNNKGKMLSDNPVLGSIRLYMPESTPAMQLGNSWNTPGGDFSGPLGKLKLQLLAAKPSIQGAAGNIGAATPGMIRQGADAFIGKQLGLESASQRAAINRGEVYNPNIELLYDAPKLREFSFSFNFTPRDPEEAAEIRQIIRAFKYYSSPYHRESDSMFEIPYLWKVRYRNEKMMGRFQPAACLAVTHQANPSSPYHSTFKDFMPTQYSIELAFKEVDIILRNDIESTETDSVAY